MTAKKDSKERKKYAQFCPKCNSIDIHQDKSTMQSLGYLPTKYICSNCGYSSFHFPEIDLEELDKLHLKKNKRPEKPESHSELIDTSYGKFYVKIMWKILGPISIIAGLIYLYFNLLVALGLIILGIIMSYITFTMKDS